MRNHVCRRPLADGSSRMSLPLLVDSRSTTQFSSHTDSSTRSDADEGAEDLLRLDLSSVQPTETPARRRSVDVFTAYGRFVGTRPWLCLSVCILLAAPMIGLRWLNVEDNIRDGYTPLDAPSRREAQVLREFYNTTAEPNLTVFLLKAKDGGSLLRMDYLEEIVNLQHFFLEDFECTLDGHNYTFTELCEPYCYVNKPLELFYSGLSAQWSNLKTNDTVDDGTVLRFPQSRVNGIRIPLQMMLYDIKLKDPSKNYDDTEDPAIALTNMERVAMLIYRGDVLNDGRDKLITHWEEEAHKYAYEVLKSDRLQVEVGLICYYFITPFKVIGIHILDKEMIEDGKRLTPFFASGFSLVGIFVTVALLAPDIKNGTFKKEKVWVTAAALLCPLFAILGSFGTMTLLQMRVNSFLLVMPTLVVGIGVDDAFLLVHSWSRNHQVSPRKRVAAVLNDVGPSMTITTATNVLSFGIGCFTPTREIQLFCFGTSLALLTVYLYHIFLFCPLLVFVGLVTDRDPPKAKAEETIPTSTLPYETPRPPPTEAEWIRIFTKVLSKKLVFIPILASLILYWGVSTYGMSAIRPRLDATKILPKTSRIQAPNAILHDIIWKEYQAISVIVNRPFNISSSEDRRWLEALAQEFEALPHSLGPETTMLWLREYDSYFFKEFDFWDILFGDTKEIEAEAVHKSSIDGSKLKSFLASPFYQHWKGFVHLSEDGDSINRFWFAVAYGNVSGWDERIELVQACRRVANRHPELNVTTWEQSGNGNYSNRVITNFFAAMFVDQMLGLKKVTLQTTLLTWVCMAVVCAVFIRNFGIVCIASLSIVSICLGVVGSLSLLGFDLDPVTVAALLMSIGLSVDYTAHTTSHFQRHRLHTANTVQCLQKTLDSVAWPMMESAFSTFLCVAPLYFSFSYTTIVFFTTIVLVTFLGLLHGLVIVPCVLVAISSFVGEARFSSVRNGHLKKRTHLRKPPTDGLIFKTKDAKDEVIVFPGDQP